MFGSIEGTYQGYPVRINPDLPSISVFLNRPCDDFKLMTLNTNQKPRSYDLGHAAFERVFKTKELNQQTADSLRGRTELFDRILALRRHRVAGIMVSNQGLVCTMYRPYRRPRAAREETANYIAAADVERILPEMVEVAGLLEAVLS
jgi:hypothetical protein